MDAPLEQCRKTPVFITKPNGHSIKLLHCDGKHNQCTHNVGSEIAFDIYCEACTKYMFQSGCKYFNQIDNLPSNKELFCPNGKFCTFIHYKSDTTYGRAVMSLTQYILDNPYTYLYNASDAFLENVLGVYRTTGLIKLISIITKVVHDRLNGNNVNEELEPKKPVAIPLVRKRTLSPLSTPNSVAQNIVDKCRSSRKEVDGEKPNENPKKRTCDELTPKESVFKAIKRLKDKHQETLKSFTTTETLDGKRSPPFPEYIPLEMTAKTANPAVSTPAVSTPAVSTPAVSTPDVSTPTLSTPAVSTPAVSTPAVSTPAVSTPAVSTPDVSTPTLSTPATPVITTPVTPSESVLSTPSNITFELVMKEVTTDKFIALINKRADLQKFDAFLSECQDTNLKNILVQKIISEL
jgi:hypothetical protein